jgi:hypothetical protein
MASIWSVAVVSFPTPKASSKSVKLSDQSLALVHTAAIKAATPLGEPPADWDGPLDVAVKADDVRDDEPFSRDLQNMLRSLTDDVQAP